MQWHEFSDGPVTVLQLRRILADLPQELEVFILDREGFMRKPRDVSWEQGGVSSWIEIAYS